MCPALPVGGWLRRLRGWLRIFLALCCVAALWTCFVSPCVETADAMQMVGLQPTDLAIYMQTKSRSRQLNLTLTNVREFLPQAPVYLLSDAGDPFDLEAKRFNVSAFMAEMHIDQAGTRSANWTCARWLDRLSTAAKWAAARGAKYLMHFEEDLRFIKRLQRIPHVDLVTMGNVAMDHIGVFTPRQAQKLRKTPDRELTKAELRRKTLSERYGARLGFSAGPGSVWKISALLNASVDDDQFDYPHSDMCIEDVAVGYGYRIRRSNDIQQITYKNENRDRPQSASLGRNLRCLICLDGCKTQCSCAPGYSLRDTLRYTSLWLTAPVNQVASVEKRSEILWSRTCGECHQKSCWPSCRDSCAALCPAVVHPHKGSTLDCEV